MLEFGQTDTKYKEQLKSELSEEIKPVNNPLTMMGWVGGKTKLSKEILQYIPTHSIYIEVFTGSGAVFFRKKQSKGSLLNDINGNLTNLFRCAQEDIDELISKCYFYHRNRKWYVDAVDSFDLEYNGNWDSKNKTSRFDRAAVYLYLIKNSFNQNEDFHFVHDTTFNSGAWGNQVFRALKAASYKLNAEHVVIENLSFTELFKKYNLYETNYKMFMYLDPPYWVANKSSYYKYIFSKSNHRKLAECLKKLSSSISWLMSYDDVNEIKDMYKDFNIIKTEEQSYTAALRKRVHKCEILIANYPLIKVQQIELIQKEDL